MKIRNTVNGGVAEADQALAKQLIASGAWEAADAPKPKPTPTPKPAPKPEPVEDTPDE